MARKPERRGEDEAVLAEYLGKEMIKTLGDGKYTEARPFTIEMNRPQQHAPQWKELLVIYSESPGVYVLIKGSQSVKGAKAEGFQMKLSFTEGRWKIISDLGDNTTYGFEIFAFLRQANELSSIEQPSPELKKKFEFE